MKNTSDLSECNVLFNDELLILVWFSLLIATEFDLENYF